MKRGLTSSLLVVALVLTAASVATAGEEEHHPKMMLPVIRHDFGRVFEMEKYAYAFSVRNQGDSDLLIEKVVPGCGCTVVEFDSSIAPGKEGKINMVVDGDKVQGRFEKSAKVYSNDSEHPVMSITIAADEIPYINVDPGGRLFVQGRYGEAVEKQVKITTNEEGIDFKVTGVTSDMDDQVTYKVDKGEKPGEWVLSVFKNPTLPTGTSFGKIVVQTNSENAPERIVPVEVITKGAITVQPQALNYGRLKFDPEGPGTPVTKTVTVLSPKSDFQILDVVTSSDAYKASVSAEVPGQRYKIDVTFTPPKKIKPRQNEFGEMTITTNDPHEPTLRVKLVARSL